MPHQLLSSFVNKSAGRFEVAAAEAARAIELDPDCAVCDYNSAVNHTYLNLFEDAATILESARTRGLEIDEMDILFWDSDRRLLFINTSNNDASHEGIAKAVAGEHVELIKGSRVFRVFGGLHRLLLQTLGLNHTISRVIRFPLSWSNQERKLGSGPGIRKS